MEKIRFMEEGQETSEDFYILEQTRIHGRDYILVTDTEEGDAEALILKDVSEPGEEEARYQAVVDEEEQRALSAVFAQLLEDVEFE